LWPKKLGFGVAFLAISLRNSDFVAKQQNDFGEAKMRGGPQAAARGGCPHRGGVAPTANAGGARTGGA
jgi:hypothetical protein